MVKLLAGKPVVETLTEDLKSSMDSLAEAGVVPALAIVRVGEKPDDLSYERTAVKRAEALGIGVKKTVLDESANQTEIENALDDVNADPSVHGCLMLRPLPSGLNEQAICDRLAIEKDIDAISSAALAAVFMDRDTGFAP